MGTQKAGYQLGLDKLGKIHGKNGNWNVNEATEQSIPKGRQIDSLEFYEKGLWGKEKEGLNQDQNTPTLDI